MFKDWDLNWRGKNQARQMGIFRVWSIFSLNYFAWQLTIILWMWQEWLIWVKWCFTKFSSVNSMNSILYDCKQRQFKHTIQNKSYHYSSLTKWPCKPFAIRESVAFKDTHLLSKWQQFFLFSACKIVLPKRVSTLIYIHTIKMELLLSMQETKN